MKPYGGPATKGLSGRRKSKVSETRTRCLRTDRKTERQGVRLLTRDERWDLSLIVNAAADSLLLSEARRHK